MTRMASEQHPSPAPPLTDALVEVEKHVGSSGWDQPPQLFALVATADLVATEPDFAASLGLPAEEIPAGALTPIEQEPLPDGPLDESLAGIQWPEEVQGCCLAQEVLLLPPDAEAEMPDQPDPLQYAASHPRRREARVVVAVLRDGSKASAVRFREDDDSSPIPADEQLLIGEDLAPNLSEALLATLF